jgi:hypothetical protein
MCFNNRIEDIGLNIQYLHVHNVKTFIDIYESYEIEFTNPYLEIKIDFIKIIQMFINMLCIYASFWFMLKAFFSKNHCLYS